MATQPSLRIGDQERNATAAELREHFADGRLTQEEFNQRLDATFAAKTQDDLSRITADLPHVRSSSAPLPSARTASGPRWPGGSASAAWTPSAYGSSGYEQSRGYRHRPRGGFSTLPTLLAALAIWLIVYDVVLAGLRFPWPGKLGLVIAIFTLVRGLLNRVFRGRGRGRR